MRGAFPDESDVFRLVTRAARRRYRVRNCGGRDNGLSDQYGAGIDDPAGDLYLTDAQGFAAGGEVSILTHHGTLRKTLVLNEVQISLYQNGKPMTLPPRITLLLLLNIISLAQSTQAQTQLPVKPPAGPGISLRSERAFAALQWKQFQPLEMFRADQKGDALLIDLHDSTLFGKLHAGPAFFDPTHSDYLEPRYRQTVEIERGRGILPVRPYLDPAETMNANNWQDAGVLGYRLDLIQMKGNKPALTGYFDSRVWFRSTTAGIRPIVSIVEGPTVGLIVSDHPDWMVIAGETDRPSRASVEVEGHGRFESNSLALRHEITINGLKPSQEYRYRFHAVSEGDTASTPWIGFRTAPGKGDFPVRFAYGGDARAAAGGGDFSSLGVNRRVLGNLAAVTYRLGAEFFLFGGDVMSGHTNSPDGYRFQSKAFKQGVAPFVHSRPIYTAMGNHEALLHIYDDGSRYGTGMDRWPYDSVSSEAVFAQEFIHPMNAPVPYPGFPPYSENVFSFHYGPIKIIVFNTNYWWSSHNRIPECGGSPEGYLLPNQLEWIAHELDEGQADPLVRYIILLGHEPSFPGGGHLGDAMWHNGDNNVRAFRLNDKGAMTPFPQGILEVRNRFWENIARTPKVAVVFASDEHNYHRMLITDTTRVGILKDDLNGNGKLDDGKISPDAAFSFPTWFVISGGAGAPYYTEQSAPWSKSVMCFTPLAHAVMIRADAGMLSLQVVSEHGQVLDEVPDLMSVKRR